MLCCDSFGYQGLKEILRMPQGVKNPAILSLSVVIPPGFMHEAKLYPGCAQTQRYSVTRRKKNSGNFMDLALY